MDVPLSMQLTRLRPHQRLGLLLGPLAAAAVLFLPSALHQIGDYGHRPAAAAAVALWMAIWWFSEALPMGVTSCLPLLLFPVLGVFEGGPARQVEEAVGPYFSAYVFLFFGGMTVGAAMERWNLHRRIALNVLSVIGTHPPRLLAGVIVATAGLSMWISNTATAVMMVPIGMALLAELEPDADRARPSAFGAAVMLAIAYAANVGGMGTKIGTPANSIFAGWVQANLGVEIGFLAFLGVGLPFVLVVLPVVWWRLWALGRTDAPTGAQGREVLRRQLQELGPMSAAEKLVAAVFAGAALFWILGDLLRPLIAPFVPGFWDGFRFTAAHYEALVAMSAAVVLLLARRVDASTFRTFPWTAILLLGGSFAMAAGISGSGLSDWLLLQLSGLTTMSLFAQLGVASFATILLSGIASNTATANVMLNVLPRSLPVLAVSTLGTSCDFALPAGTPPNAIVFGSGRVRLPTMMKTGILLDVVAGVLLTVYGWLWLSTFLA